MEEGVALQDRLFQEILLGDKRSPYRWQQEACRRLVGGKVPDKILAPTAAGKVMMIPTYLAALATQALADEVTLPRRLVFVVNRRVLVDEATRLAEKLLELVQGEKIPALRDALCRLSATGEALQIATLRGQFADSGRWSTDPTTPAIILATPDMLGSRLLFRGYGLGRNRAAMQAGLLAMDTLVIHDEAHLAPAFSALLREIEQKVAPQAAAIGVPPLQLIEMTATDRTGSISGRGVLRCDPSADKDLSNRMSAPKRLFLEEHANGTAAHERIAAIVAEEAKRHKAIAIFVTSPDEAHAISKLLTSGKDASSAPNLPPDRVIVLTGTMRGAERDELLKTAAWKRVAAERSDEEDKETAVLIATSAGEIGIDLDVDALIGDEATIDRQIQRMGRANRRGRSIANIYLLSVPPKLPKPADSSKPSKKAKGKKASPTTDGPTRAQRASQLLATLPLLENGGQDASPAALIRLQEHPDYFLAIEPSPLSRELEAGVLELFASTSHSLAELKAPDPALWIHGLAPPAPEIELVWRILPAVPNNELKKWLTVWPIHRLERVRLPLSPRLKRYLVWLQTQADKKRYSMPVWLDHNYEVVGTLEAEARAGLTLLIDHRIGGLDRHGLVSHQAEDAVSDVSEAQFKGRKVAQLSVRHDPDSERWFSIPKPNSSEPVVEAHSPEALTTKIYPNKECVWLDITSSNHLTVWLRDVEPEVSDTAEGLTRHARLLDEHQDLAAAAAIRLTGKLGLALPLAQQVIRSAHGHDEGKARLCWQRAIRNPDPAVPLGKSGQPSFDRHLNAGYRHELGSIVALPDTDNLVRHLIAAHHGNARPNFSTQALVHAGCREAAEGAQYAFDEAVARYGHWSVAYLEALVKCADILAETHAETLAEDSEPSTKPLHGSQPDQALHAEGVLIGFDASNPGEYLASMGLLWLVAQTCPEAKLSWRHQTACFDGVNEADLAAALLRLGQAHVERDDTRAAVMLQSNPGEKYPPLRLDFGEQAFPINVWCNPRLEHKSSWRFAAGRSDGLVTLTNLLSQCHDTLPLASAGDLLAVCQVEGAASAGSDGTGKAQRFRFDAKTSWTALDVGWSPYEEELAFSRPWVEVLALLGLQHAFLPPWHRNDVYATWTRPRSVRQAVLAARGLTGDILHRYTPHFPSSGQNTDTYPATANVHGEKSVCPKIFVI